MKSADYLNAPGHSLKGFCPLCFIPGRNCKIHCAQILKEQFWAHEDVKLRAGTRRDPARQIRGLLHHEYPGRQICRQLWLLGDAVVEAIR